MRIACIAGTDLRMDHRARAHARALGVAGHEVMLFGVLARGAEPEEDLGPALIVRTALPGWRRDAADGAAWRAARWVRRFARVVQAAEARGVGFDAFHAFGVDVAGPTAQAAARRDAAFVLDDTGLGRLDVVERRTRELPLGARRSAAELMVGYLRRGEERLQRSVRAAANAVIAASDALARDGRARWGGPPATVVHDSFVTPPRRRSERLRTRLGVYPDDRLIALREDDAAGAPAVVRALRVLGSGHVLVLLGWSRSATDLLALAEREGVSSHVRVIPPAPQDEMLELCASADAVVLTASPVDRLARLGVPRSLFESLAAAAPIVAPDLEGVGTLVRRTGAGVLYAGRDPADPGAIAEALRAVLLDPSLAEACRDGARAALRGELAWQHQAAALVRTYESGLVAV